MSPPMVEHADGLPLPQRYWAILTIALGITMSVIDGAIANVALPTIAIDLDHRIEDQLHDSRRDRIRRKARVGRGRRGFDVDLQVTRRRGHGMAASKRQCCA